MDQQQAVEFTQKALARGATPEQVAYVLAERMNAPVEAIFRFVQRIAAQQAVPVAAPVSVVEPPRQSEPPPAQVMAEEPATLVQGFAAIPPPPPAPKPAVQPAPVMAATQLSVQPPMPAVQPPAPAASAVVTETPAGGRGETRGRGNSAILTQDPAIYEQVLQELKRAHRPSDIALKLSKAHGVRWTDAERFVIEVATRNHSMLQRRTNVTVLFFSGASLLAGLALLVIGILAVMDILAGQPADNLGQAIGTLIGGIALVLGGAIGIYMISRPSSR